MTNEPDSRPDLQNLTVALREIASGEYVTQIERLDGIVNNDRFRRLLIAVSQARGFATELLAEPRWDLLTPSEVSSILSKVQAVGGALRDTKSFNGETNSISSQLNGVLSALEPALVQLRAVTLPYLAYLRSTPERASDVASEQHAALTALLNNMQTDSTKMSREAQQVLSEIHADRQRIAEALAEAEDALRASREAAGSAAIAAHASTFRKEAERADEAAGKWLGASVLITVLTGVVAAVLFLAWEQDGSAGEARNLQVILLKTFAVSAGIYFIAVAVRVFRAQMHIAVTNRHRANALTTYNAFASSTPQGSDAHEKLLLEAAHTIFGHTPSGLIEHGGDSIEILDGVSSLIRKG